MSACKSGWGAKILRLFKKDIRNFLHNNIMTLYIGMGLYILWYFQNIGSLYSFIVDINMLTIYSVLTLRWSRKSGSVVVSALDSGPWGREFKARRGRELLTSKKAASESTQLEWVHLVYTWWNQRRRGRGDGHHPHYSSTCIQIWLLQWILARSSSWLCSTLLLHLTAWIMSFFFDVSIATADWLNR